MAIEDEVRECCDDIEEVHKDAERLRGAGVEESKEHLAKFDSKLDPSQTAMGLRRFVRAASVRDSGEANRIRSRMSLWAGLYIFAFAVVLSLIGFDLVMSMDPHWVSTLFGAYHFVKAFYIGLGGLIILAAIVYQRRGKSSGLAANHFHDIGKLFLAFCLMWADFFYVQLVVIWYGNLPEETSFLFLRMTRPEWRGIATATGRSWSVSDRCRITSRSSRRKGSMSEISSTRATAISGRPRSPTPGSTWTGC